MTNFGVFIIAMFIVLAIANGSLWYTNYKEKKFRKSIKNKVTAEELEQHLDEYLDKVEDGENVFIEYEGQWYTIVKVDKDGKSCLEFTNDATEKNNL